MLGMQRLYIQPVRQTFSMNKFGFLLVVCWLLTGCEPASEQRSPYVSNSSDQDIYALGFSSRQVNVNGVNLHYLQKGSGHTVMFLHGFPYFSGAWYKLMSPISQCAQVIAPDNRGYGYSDKPDSTQAYQLQILIDDVRQLIQRVSPDAPVTIVGHDWGGVVSWSLASEFPELVDKLVIINAPPLNTFLHTLQTSNAQRDASRYVKFIKSPLSEWYFWFKGADVLWTDKLQNSVEKGQLSDSFKKAYLQAWQTPNAARGAVSWYRANIPEFDALRDIHLSEDAFVPVETPSLLIWSEHDPAFVTDTFEAIKRSQPDLLVKTINTDNHAPFLEQSELVLTYLSEFVGLDKCLSGVNGKATIE